MGLFAQPVLPYAYPRQMGASELKESMLRLRVLGSALFIAAHPDDENTRLIAWLAGERKVNTTYLSITRGDGGQNLIGSEIEEMLGVLRTQELLMARGVDRGEQMFTRANDFGYSKHPDETMQIWDRQEVLADVVWAIRRTRPYVVINRFDHRSPGTTHGHHTASAMLSLEAYRLAADPTAFPEQLKFVDTWQVSRIFFNTSWWFYGSREAFDAADKSNLISVDAGAYNTARGLSYTEIAARSRSMHRCQGFGSTGSRGSDTEYLEWLDGLPMPLTETLISGSQDPFAGIDLSWKRIPGGEKVDAQLAKVEGAFDQSNPSKSVPGLLKAWQLMESLQSDPRVAKKRLETADLIRQCMGFWVEGVATSALVTPGDSLRVNLEIINRSGVESVLTQVLIVDTDGNQIAELADLPVTLVANESKKEGMTMLVPTTERLSTAYWLQQPATTGMYNVPEQKLRGLPQSPAPLRLQIMLQIGGVSFPLSTPIIFKENDPVRGEVYQPLELVPPAVVNVDRPVYLFNSSEPRAMKFTVKANRDGVRGTLVTHWPAGWQGTAGPSFDLKKKGEEQTVEWLVTPPKDSETTTLIVELEVDGRRYPYAMRTVAYDHIPAQTILTPASVRLSRLDLTVHSRNIGYIMGAGDDIPAALNEIGCQVTLLEDADLRPDGLAERLAHFDAVIAGIRAYNTRDRLAFAQDGINQYIENGGTYLVQYNTNRGLVTEQLGPFPFTLSRDRVTEENAPVEILDPAHPVLTSPNPIGQQDFDGWKQERGLYFAGKWDPALQTVLASHDKGESNLDGGLLVAPYGKGWYAFTGYSFFRELPNGVPGAFRLFANIISLGK